MVAEAVRDFVCDCNLPGLPGTDTWDDDQNARRSGMSLPIGDFSEWVIFRAIKLGLNKAGSDPWLTLSKFGMPSQVQVEVVGAIAKCAG
jgi:hypothetical protein